MRLFFSESSRRYIKQGSVCFCVSEAEPETQSQKTRNSDQSERQIFRTNGV